MKDKDFRIKKLKFYNNFLIDNGIDKDFGDFLGMYLLGTQIHDKLLPAFVCFQGLLAIKRLFSSMKYVSSYEENLFELNSNYNKDYEKLKEKYDLYVKKLAEYLKRYDYLDELNIGIYFSLMLHSGDLSVPNCFEYKKIDLDDDTLYPGTLGARIVSGYGVCRNMAALLADLYKELGYDAFYLGVYSYPKNFILHPIRFVKNNIAHASVLVNSKRGKFIIDPTWKAIGLLSNDAKKTKLLIDFDGEEYDYNQFLISYKENGYTDVVDIQYYKQNNNLDLDIDEIKNRYNMLSIMHRQSEVNFYGEEYKKIFKDENLDLMKEIQNLENNLTLKKHKVKNIKNV